MSNPPVVIKLGSELYDQLLKTCPHCGRVLPLAKFGLRRKQPHEEEVTLQSWCEDCR